MMNQTTHLSLYGTAVQVVPEAEYQAEIEKKRKENEAQLFTSDADAFVRKGQ